MTNFYRNNYIQVYCFADVNIYHYRLYAYSDTGMFPTRDKITSKYRYVAKRNTYDLP